MSQVYLTLNAGSSTLKLSAWRRDTHARLLDGLIDHFGSTGSTLTLSRPGGSKQNRALPKPDPRSAVQALLEALHALGLQPAAAIHRVVHGGNRYSKPVFIDGEVRADLEELIPLAPLHQPVSLSVIDALSLWQPKLTQIACFDTGFHHVEQSRFNRFAIARHWYDEGVRRYGFHGLSYASIARQLPDIGLGQARVVVCHLGSGSSACALQNGKSVATSMGFSALDGLVMGTRPGTLDPEVVLYWIEQKGMTVNDVRNELYRKSGLLGLSGLSADMRELLTSDRPEAVEAVEIFCDRVAREVASLATALDGFDALVFTAGIGEHSPEIRARILNRLAWLGFKLDEEANAGAGHRQCLTKPTSKRAAWVLTTDEEGEMLREGLSLLEPA
jgi:acetate kinase